MWVWRWFISLFRSKPRPWYLSKKECRKRGIEVTDTYIRRIRR